MNFRAAVVLLPLVACLSACDQSGGTDPPVAVAANDAVQQTAQPTPPGGDMTISPADFDLRNRLGDQTSPYLLQHQHNPVFWFPWGAEAFEAARALDRPIFLSVGYSTCYWCHVMERESFENQTIADYLNEHFICIKVDREERPDVDDIYMAAVQAMTNRGGWPMSVFIDPFTLRPFLGGTYFPPEDRPGVPGFLSVLKQVEGFWRTQRTAIETQASQLADAVEQYLTLRAAPAEVSDRNVERGVSELLSRYDRADAGFGAAPKFPMSSYCDLLMGAAWELGPVRDTVTHTLDRMAIGGMYDQIGGGFHRYSTDAKWLVPHFEKMLYDNAQLASTYAMAYELTDDPFYAQILRETLDYVLREMTGPEGGFYSAQDAEVNHREGENYLWVADQVRSALEEAGEPDLVEFALEVYGFNQGTNFTDPHHPEDGPKNVVFLTARPDVLAEQMDIELDEFNTRLGRVNEILLAVRDTRDQPGLDDKVLSGWNGLMIAGMADGGRVLEASEYIEAAHQAADFVLTTMRAPDGGLLRSYRKGEAKIPAFLVDYAFMIHGLLAIYRADRSKAMLDAAQQLTAEARKRFWDEAYGGYFDTLDGQEDLFVRTKSVADGAIPAGNGMMLENLVDLYEITGEQHYLDDASATMRSVSSVVSRQPIASVVATRALHRLAQKHPEAIDAPLVVAPGDDNVVRISTDVKNISLAPGTEKTFDITVRIAKGFHINANRPGPSFLIPLKVELVGGTGLTVQADYPPGETYTGPIADEPVLVHNNKVVIPVRVQCTGPIMGRPRLAVTYQACTNQVCLEPVTDILTVRFTAE
jgi:hypothetical protein